MNNLTFAFDVYGTLIDTNGVLELLEKFVGDKAESFSQTWRNKQLEYSFRRECMQNYIEFDICTKQALEFACLFHQISLEENQKKQLMDIYNVLPIFDDVKKSLTELKENGAKIFAFSNGKMESIKKLLHNANIKDLFSGIISVDNIKTFKPSPAVYKYFLEKTNSSIENTWLISSNPFDITGAVSTGMKAIWVKRTSNSIFDPWETKPTIIINSLLELKEKFNLS